jgi:hypothetical protein
MILPSRLLAVWLAAVLLTSAAHAQQPAPASPSPAQLALARELTDLMGLSKIADPMMPAFANQIRQRTVTRPELINDLEQVLQSMGPEIEKQKQPLIEVPARLYANAFTEAELKDIIAFYKTPAGQKYFQTTPRILDEMDVETRRWGDHVSQYVMNRVRAEMAKRGHQM